MKLDNSGAEKNLSWYKAFLGQRITDGLDKGIYVLTFYAKAKEAGTPVSVYIKQTNEEKNAKPTPSQKLPEVTRPSPTR